MLRSVYFFTKSISIELEKPIQNCEAMNGPTALDKQ